MNERTMIAGTIALGLAVAATTAPAQDEREREPARDAARYRFHKASSLEGAEVANPNGEVIGSVADFVLDRGSGQIEYALLRSGDVLGIGGKTIAVRYERFGYDDKKGRLTLRMTPEQVERAAAFVPEKWSELNTTWAEEMDEQLREDGRAAGDPYGEMIAGASKERVRGTIAAVRRVDMARNDQQVVVVVRGEKGDKEDLVNVVLGPSWFVMGHEAAPMRGDTIAADVLVIREPAPRRAVAVSAEIDGRTIELRDDEGEPLWLLPREEPSAEQDEPRPRSRSGRLLLLSNLKGADAVALDENGGEIESVVIERRSGRVAMVGFDPNENFLGIADTIRCVPWPVLSVRRDGTVAIDAEKAMLESCEPMPEDVGVFSNPARLVPVYRVFDIDVYRFEPLPEPAAAEVEPPATTGEAPAAWIDAARTGKSVSLTGVIADQATLAPTAGAAEVRTLTLQTRVGERRTVILGPAWFMNRQRIKFGSGEAVSVEGRMVAIDGRECIVAMSIERGGETIRLWEDDEPLWDAP